MRNFEQILQGDAETLACGRQLAPLLAGRNLLVFLQGELGAGKTTLVRGILQGLGHIGPVRSPTYSIYETYQTGAGPVHHFDLYRLAQGDELEVVGARDMIGDGLCLIEWPQRASGWLPNANLVIELEIHGDSRQIRVCWQNSEE